MKFRKHLLRFKLPLLFSIALAFPLVWAASHWKEQGERREKGEREGKGVDNDALYPRLWEQMFLRGRQTR
ncbi:MAG TPA: hypothetical protein VJ873_11860, partial [bacterium]|nr:hypothetical protein [bacterium]